MGEEEGVEEAGEGEKVGVREEEGRWKISDEAERQVGGGALAEWVERRHVFGEEGGRRERVDGAEREKDGLSELGELGGCAYAD